MTYHKSKPKCKWMNGFSLNSNLPISQLASPPRDAYFTLFVDIHPGKVCPFYSIYLTNWEKLPIFGHFYPGRVFYFAVKYSPLWRVKNVIFYNFVTNIWRLTFFLCSSDFLKEQSSFLIEFIRLIDLKLLLSYLPCNSDVIVKILTWINNVNIKEGVVFQISWIASSRENLQEQAFIQFTCTRC